MESSKRSLGKFILDFIMETECAPRPVVQSNSQFNWTKLFRWCCTLVLISASLVAAFVAIVVSRHGDPGPIAGILLMGFGMYAMYIPAFSKFKLATNKFMYYQHFIMMLIQAIAILAVLNAIGFQHIDNEALISMGIIAFTLCFSFWIFYKLYSLKDNS